MQMMKVIPGRACAHTNVEMSQSDCFCAAAFERKKYGHKERHFHTPKSQWRNLGTNTLNSLN
jgi:hypothetical protein